MPALAIIVPTIGRNTLTRTLGSLRGQITANDVVMVVLDAHTMTPEHCDDVERLVSSAAALFPSPPRVMRHDAGHGCWGHPQRNAAMLAAPSEMWLVFNDDDDVFTPGALDAVRSAIDAQESPRPLLFQFITPWRSVLWSQPQRVVLGEIGTPCLVLRRDMVGDARWGDRYEGDFDMISAVVEAHGGPTGVDWVPHVIVKTRPEPT